MKPREQIIIVGAGLSGLSLAYELSKEGITAVILEASPRLGGRIQTADGALGTPLELGATWFSDQHINLLGLMDELGLKKFHQFSAGISLFQTKSFEPPQRFFVPESDAPSYRLAGGTARLITTLNERLTDNIVKLNTKVKAIEDCGQALKISTAAGEEYFAEKAVICLPPALIFSNLHFSPHLPENVNQVLPLVQTWMAGSIKFTIEYPNAFWRKNGYSGMLYSHAGIIAEMYDHTSMEGDKFGFTGFLNGGAAKYSKEVRKEFVLKQLVELLGKEAEQATTYLDKVWDEEYLVADNFINQRPHQNQGHPFLQQPYFGGKLFFCGTETAIQFGGYMEGAIMAARATAKRLLTDKYV